MSCEFEKNDNLSRKNEILRARREEFVDLPLQGMTRLCNMKFDAPQQVMRFDDEIMITLNNLVVAASQDYSTRSKNLNDSSWQLRVQNRSKNSALGLNTAYNLCVFLHVVLSKIAL